jgi:membrane associated rhomboid family serine protease
MFLPIGDAPNAKGPPAPYVTWALILVNVAAFLLLNVPLGSQQADFGSPEFREYLEVMVRELQGRVDPRELAAQTSAYDLFAFEHGYRPASPQWADLLSCMFLHGSFMHLFGNMLFLWIYGDNVERRIGAFPYLFWYVVTGAAGTLTHALVFRDSNVPLVGASGAISGVLGFYFVFFPRNVVRVLAFLPPFLMQVFEIPARLVLGFYLVWDNLLPFFVASGGGVAHGAHIGGFLAGALVAWTVERRAAQARPASFAPSREGPRGRDRVRGALADGRHADAARAYFALAPSEASGALRPDEAVELASWLRAQGHADAALTLLRRVVRDTPAAPGVAEAYAAAGLILLRDLGEPTAAYQYLLTAYELGPDPATRAAVRSALAEIDERQKLRIGRPRNPHPW